MSSSSASNTGPSKESRGTSPWCFHIDSMSVHGDRIAIGTSSLTGSIWSGEIFVCPSISMIEGKKEYHVCDLPNVSVAHTTHGNTSLLWLNDDTILSASDAGCLDAWTVHDDNGIVATSSVSAHDCIASSIALKSRGGGGDGDLLLSAGWDCMLKMWDVDELLSGGNAGLTGVFRGHTDAVLDVKWCPDSAAMFASVGRDGAMKLWDSRCCSRASATVSEINDGPLCVAFGSSGSDILFTGHESGSIIQHDMRMISNRQRYVVATRDICVLVSDCDELVFGSDDCTAGVIPSLSNISQNQCKYQHTDFVRAIAFMETNNDMKYWLSGGWDGCVIAHPITTK